MGTQKSKKIVVLGHFGVGKTSLIRRFVDNVFSEKYKVTIGVHISKKIIRTAKNESISLILWDLEGTDDAQTIRDAYLLGTHGVIFVFDVTRPGTFADMNFYMDILSKKTPKAQLLVIGNKLDLVNPNELQILLNNNNISYDFLTSAKTGNSVEEAFKQLANLLNT